MHQLFKHWKHEMIPTLRFDEQNCLDNIMFGEGGRGKVANKKYYFVFMSINLLNFGVMCTSVLSDADGDRIVIKTFMCSSIFCEHYEPLLRLVANFALDVCYVCSFFFAHTVK